MNWRISSRIAISAFATATTALRTMINRLIIRFSRLTLEEVTIACSYIACRNSSLTLLDVEYLPPCQSTEHSTTCCSARTLIRSYPDSAGFRSKGKAHSTAPTQRLYRGTHKIHLKKLLLTNNLKAQTRQRVSSTIILWMLDVEYLPPVRATNSRLENAKKPDYQSGFFVPVVRL